MPVQTTIKDYIYIPDGTQVQIKESGAGAYTDVGAVEGDVTCSLEYDINKVESGNAGIVINNIKNMKMTGGFTLMNLNPVNIVRLSGGIFSSTTTAASENSSIPDQTVAAGWETKVPYELVLYTSSTDDTKLKMATAPAVTTVTLNHGTPEVLVADEEYFIVEDSNSYSGYSIVFVAANMESASPTTYSITIDYAANTPRAATTIYAGSSTVTLAAASMKFTHTDSSSLTRELELFSVTPQSGGMQFNFKGATSDGVETMPLTFEANIDPDLTDGQQLMSWTVMNGAS